MDYSSQIQNFERELSINRGIIHQEYWHIGNAVLEHRDLAEGVKKDPKATLQRLLEDAENKRSTRSEILENISRMEAQLKSAEDLRSGITSRKAELERLNGEMQQVLRDFGAHAFELYASSPQSYLQLHQGFQDLDALHRHQFNLETRIDSLQKKADGDPLFKRLVSQTRLQLQKNQQKGMEKKIDEALKKTGSTLLNHPDVEAGNYPGIENFIKPARNQQQKIAEIEKIIEKHRKELQGLEEEIKAAAGSRKPTEHITELQLRISETDEEQRKILTEAGLLMYEQLSDSPPQPLSEYFTNLGQLLTENRTKEEKIQRLQAAQKILALEDEKARFVMKWDKLTRQLEDLKEQLSRVGTTIDNLDAEIESQGKIRGDEKELI
jgi:chromosome segregation ATPase